MKSESIILFETANYKFDDTEKEGIIVITEYRFIYNFLIQEDESFNFQLLILNKIEKTNIKKNYGKYSIDLTTKDNRSFRFDILKDDNQKLFHYLSNFVQPKDTNLYYKFAVKYRDYHPVNSNGWEIYDPIKEYSRQGFKFNNPEEEVKKFLIFRKN